MRYRKIPNETIRRLPVYLRALMMLRQNGHTNVSSSSLATVVNVHAWQIRKDFSHFGEFGTRGVGYEISTLTRQIERILQLNSTHRAALVGAGNLGTALLAYPGFGVYGLEIAAAFDSDPTKVGRTIGDIRVEDISQIGTLRERGVTLAIIAVPREAAQNVADALVSAGVKGILNFAPAHITAPKKIKVITIDIATDLARLPYYIPAGKGAAVGRETVQNSFN